MLSRIADSLFWLNRYMERADGLLRSMKTNYILSLDKGINSNLTWRPVLEIYTNLDDSRIETLENDTGATLRYLLTDTANMNSLKAILSRARENARGVQDHITKETWEQVNEMYHMVNDPNISSDLTPYHTLEIMENFSKSSLLFMGVADVTMPRGAGWSYMNLGKYIERCTQTNEIGDREFRAIDYDFDNEIDIIQWQYLLLSVSGFELHLKTYRSGNHTKNVLHQILLNEDFTRSVIYSLNRVGKYLFDVISENPSCDNSEIKRVFGKLHSEIKYLDFDELDKAEIEQCLQNVRTGIIKFSRCLTRNFFSYS